MQLNRFYTKYGRKPAILLNEINSIRCNTIIVGCNLIALYQIMPMQIIKITYDNLIPMRKLLVFNIWELVC
ncbi:hypothetical protein A7Q01_02110 [Eikenella sp. NML96-A-049]|nr:hypothetical protein A7Q01_02110 [Eikenella sp. NML96-A-049]